jgi:hypothetical protein
MFISDLSHFQTVETTAVLGGSKKHGYSKKFYVDIYVDQDADGGKAYAKSYKGDAYAYADADNDSYIEIDF